ncbi:DUF6630 family protein [Selenomonas sp. oral taxon 138]|uniref:DUF6630 family protein n=1 Tax=Selenomonas sp. oral taxon 138 TaxID=712532 RepID=UPI0003461139|nr:DUF6630 family protein [Selenomonas sp. oral taxon 138]
MRLYHWIQAKMFSTYEDWCLKCSSMNRHGFHIVGIENELKSMRDGYNMFVEICPPQAVEGCTSMKAISGATADQVNLLLEMEGKRYCRAGLSYDDAAQIMKAFVQKRVLPDVAEYEPTEDDPKAIADTFAAFANILCVDVAYTKQLQKKLQVRGSTGIDTAWEGLCKKLVRSGRAVALDWKSEREDFVAAVQSLTAGTGLAVDGDMLGETDGISVWSKDVNAHWHDHVLAAMDMNNEDYVLLVLTRADFVRAAECARVLLHRIARAEEM